MAETKTEQAKPIAYVFFDRDRDWECAITDSKEKLEGLDGLYLGGEVNTLSEVFDLLEAHDFDPEYFYNFVDDMPHHLYNLLNKEDAYVY